MEDKRWLRLLQPGITAIVGAGGKTTVLERLVAYGHGANLPVAVSTTAEADGERLAEIEDLDIICTNDREEGEAFCIEKMNAHRVPAWFSSVSEEGIYKGIDADTLEWLRVRHPAWYIIVEADGAHHKWLKAPLPEEAPIPQDCDTLIGVVNLQMLGSSITDERAAGPGSRRRTGGFDHESSYGGYRYARLAGKAVDASSRVVSYFRLTQSTLLQRL